jgi:hypothetical protein
MVKTQSQSQYSLFSLGMFTYAYERQTKLNTYFYLFQLNFLICDAFQLISIQVLGLLINLFHKVGTDSR